MLTAIVTSLQSLITKQLSVSAFIPALMFWFGNAAMLYHLWEPFRGLVNRTLSQPTLGQASVLITCAVGGVAVSAYALSAVMPTIQSILEGHWSEWLARIYSQGPARRLEFVNQKAAYYRQLRGELERVVHQAPQVEHWQTRLREARQMGSNASRGFSYYTAEAASAGEVHKLVKLRWKASAITAEQIETAVGALVPDLRTNDADCKGPDGRWTLEEVRQQLWDVIEYAVSHAQEKYRKWINRRRFSFGTTLAPTRMGNVAQTIQSYAVERYDFNFELLWSRMQRVLQKDTNFGPILQSAKTQLDFLVASCALTAAWTLFWILTLGSMQLFSGHGDPELLMGAGIGGAVVAWLWYCAGVVQYRTFADVLRTSIDLFRFDLLNELHLPLPTGVLDERALWNTVDRLQALYELEDLRYVLPKSGT